MQTLNECILLPDRCVARSPQQKGNNLAQFHEVKFALDGSEDSIQWQLYVACKYYTIELTGMYLIQYQAYIVCQNVLSKTDISESTFGASVVRLMEHWQVKEWTSSGVSA